MEDYDPLRTPDTSAWLALDEQQRIDLVTQYHREAGDEAPNEAVHAVLHVIVENQIALGDEIPVRLTLIRLMREGLDRHSAVHAIADILSRNLHDVMADENTTPDIDESYYKELKKLKARKWLRSFE